MSSDPLVSINLVTYNRAFMLHRSINSILKQNYSNIELIIVNDSSIDNTEEVINSYITFSSQIKYYNNKINIGSAASRNVALSHSIGEYIAFMDDDDEWSDLEKISKQVKYFQELPPSIVLISTGINRIINGVFAETYLPTKNQLSLKKILSDNGIIFCPTVMIRRSIVDLGIRFDDRLRMGDDADFYRECFVKRGFDFEIMQIATTDVHYHLFEKQRRFSGKNIDYYDHFFELTLFKYNSFLRKFSKEFAYWYFNLARTKLAIAKKDKSVILLLRSF